MAEGVNFAITHRLTSATGSFQDFSLTFRVNPPMVGTAGFEPARLSLLLPKQARYQATVYAPMK